MIDFTKQQQIYDTIKTIPNKELWSFAGLLSKAVFNAQKETKELTKQLEKASAHTTSDEVSDDQLRAKLRSILIKKLEDNSISAAEIAQLKDVFGLTNAKQDINVQVISFKKFLEQE